MHIVGIIPFFKVIFLTSNSTLEGVSGGSHGTAKITRTWRPHSKVDETEVWMKGCSL